MPYTIRGKTTLAYFFLLALFFVLTVAIAPTANATPDYTHTVKLKPDKPMFAKGNHKFGVNSKRYTGVHVERVANRKIK